MRGPKKRLTPFGKMVVKALADRDMSRAELAATVGTSPQYMSYILNGTRSGEKYLPAIIAALALDPKKAERAACSILPVQCWRGMLRRRRKRALRKQAIQSGKSGRALFGTE